MDFVRGAAEAGHNVGNLLEGKLLSSPNFQSGSGMTSILSVEDSSLSSRFGETDTLVCSHRMV